MDVQSFHATGDDSPYWVNDVAQIIVVVIGIIDNSAFIYLINSNVPIFPPHTTLTTLASR